MYPVMKRRTFVKTVAAATVGAGASGITAGQPEPEGADGPVEGVRIHRFEREGTVAEHLADADVAVDDLDGVDPEAAVYSHTEQFVPRRGQLRTERGRSPITLQEAAVPESVFESTVQRARERGGKRGLAVDERLSGAVEVRYEDTAEIDTFEQFRLAERELREQASVGPDVTDVDFPLHVYKADDPDGSSDLSERTGPINVGWDVGMDAAAVDDGTKTWAHWSIYLASDRYVIDGSQVKKQDEHMGWNLFPYDQANQYHARLYDVNSSDSPVVAQAHRDPVDHGHLFDPDWEFADSRDYVADSSPWNGDYAEATWDINNEHGYDDSTCYGLFDRVY
jgi:hypothetical protein